MPHLLNKRNNTMGMHKAEKVTQSSLLANLGKLTNEDCNKENNSIKYIPRSMKPVIGTQVQLTFKGSLLKGQIGYVTKVIEITLADPIYLVEFENGSGIVARKCPLSHLNLNPAMYDHYRRKFGLISAMDKPLEVEEYKENKEGVE